MKEIDYEKIRSFDSKRKLRAVYGYQYLPYCSLIVALKLSDWRYRDVLEFLYTNIDEFIEIPKANRIDNNDLSKMVSYWKKNSLINFDEVGIERQKISQSVKKELVEKPFNVSPGVTNVSVFGAQQASFLLDEFVKLLSAKGVLVENERQAIEQFYSNFKDKYSKYSLVNEYIAQHSNLIRD